MANPSPALLVLLLSTLTAQVSCDLYNDICSPSVHCNVAAGLICVSGRCACTRQDLVEPHISNYNLVWDSTRNLCVGLNGSSCVGTRDNPVPDGMKRIECVDRHTCFQLPRAPLSIGICRPAPAVFLHGGACATHGKNSTALQFCDAALGLFCDSNNVCSCSNERVNTSPDYSMVWSEERGRCVGDVGSGCIGTREGPVPLGQKAVECVSEALCVQADGQTPGVGICTRTGGTAENSAPKVLRNEVITIGLFVLPYFAVYLRG